MHYAREIVHLFTARIQSLRLLSLYNNFVTPSCFLAPQKQRRCLHVLMIIAAKGANSWRFLKFPIFQKRLDRLLLGAQELHESTVRWLKINSQSQRCNIFRPAFHYMNFWRIRWRYFHQKANLLDSNLGLVSLLQRSGRSILNNR